jgi:hypothetical protein
MWLLGESGKKKKKKKNKKKKKKKGSRLPYAAVMADRVGTSMQGWRRC